ncbi:unnamed protein product [Rotaria magnacalcarata]|uniref:B box-type domain-containing protein n=3 Tax=Rotaria magnacalcarata TaxID=392030 RepID=A0A815LTE9_9BILA|nr:unnamed protein product [Rotaria magnacalcarata]CAF1480123.1 unnamed protein product [Rotaria magnacalcarata]
MTEEQHCGKCRKAVCVAKCHGCKKSFCMPHFVKHRLHLAQRMDNLREKFELLQNDINKDNFKQSLLSNIYDWEQRSMRKIHEIAENARKDVEEKLLALKSDVEISIGQIVRDFQANAEADNYTEFELEKWSKRIFNLRDSLEHPSTIEIVEDNKLSSTIYGIKIIEQKRRQESLYTNSISETVSYTSEQSMELIPEHFVPMYGPCRLSEDKYVATHSSYRAGLSQLTGSNNYSSGKHSISFLIEKKGIKNMFIGIHSASNEASSSFDRSIYGWWNLDYVIINGEHEAGDDSLVIQTGDKITLTVDCDNLQIHFEHHRTRKICHIPIELNTCPFPWRILIRLLMADDSIRICN